MRKAVAPAFLATSAVFHYLGPAFAVLLFSRIDVIGVAWLRIAGAAAVFAIWRRPWRTTAALRLRSHPQPPTTAPTLRRRRWHSVRWPESAQLRILLALGVVLAAMNAIFYLAIARLPLSTVGAIEFLGVVALAALGARTPRNVAALLLAVGGVVVLTDVRLAGSRLGFALAFANCALFMLYVTLGHKIANTGTSGVDQLGAAMLVAAVLATPVGLGAALPAFTHPWWLLAGFAVAVCSSVIPYVLDQLAMARLRRSAYALMLCLLPACATIIGAVVLGQWPTAQDLTGVALVIIGVALHQQQEPKSTPERTPA